MRVCARAYVCMRDEKLRREGPVEKLCGWVRVCVGSWVCVGGWVCGFVCVGVCVCVCVCV